MVARWANRAWRFAPSRTANYVDHTWQNKNRVSQFTGQMVTEGEAESIHAAWAASPPSSIQALHASIDLREATYGVLIAALGAADETTPDAAHELERLNLRWAAATARSELVLGGPSGPAAGLRVGTAPALLIADRLAHAAVDLVRTVDLGRLRVCPILEGGCGWLFLDHSRNGSRRWCAMALPDLLT